MPPTKKRRPRRQSEAALPRVPLLGTAPTNPPPLALLVVDPPWRFDDRLPGGRGATTHYATMPVDEIVRLELPALAPDCALFLWRVSAMQREALDVLDAWGFRAAGEMVWRKRRKCGACQGSGRTSEPCSGCARSAKRRQSCQLCGGAGRVETLAPCVECAGAGDRLFLGMGRTVRAGHEVCLIGTRGRPAVLDKGMRSVFDARMPEDARGRLIHSAKPDAFYARAARLFGGPKGELFARKTRPGWHQWGLELGSLDEPAEVTR